jgi:uncharacterized SAM-binding protein YcdF (DUF218 family)
MPASVPRHRRKLPIALGIGALMIAAGSWAFAGLGRFLAAEQPLQKADAIFVFAGSLAERPLEAADLFHEGYAPRIVITLATSDQMTFQLRKRGVRIPTQFDLNREVLLQLGIPASALVTPTFVHDNTAEEARTLRELAIEHKWRLVILVSSKYHLRRLTLAAGRALRGTDVKIVPRGSRYDASAPERWWTRRRDIRWVASELPKLVAYAVGFGM